MLFLKLIQQLVKALNSDGTPGQVAAGMALGAVFGLTPLMNLHNLVLFGCALIFNVSMPGVFLGWTLSVPVGFALDPLFDAVGSWLLGAPALRACGRRSTTCPSCRSPTSTTRSSSAASWSGW